MNHVRPTRVRPAGGNPRPVRLLTMLLLPVVAFAIASCGDGAQPRVPYSDVPEGKPAGLGAAVPDPKEVLETKEAGLLPDFLNKLTGASKERITTLYKGSVDHFQAFDHVPCYCGCAAYATPHKSLASCFIKEKGANGSHTFTDHSTSCDICEGVAQMTLDGIAAARPLKDVRADIFKKYNYTQIWTDTPPVP